MMRKILRKLKSRSKERLKTCHSDLQKLFEEVNQHFQCVILEGHRSASRQKKLFKAGRTQTMNSKHREFPSLAVDVSPHPLDWKDEKRFYYFAGYVKRAAEQLGIELRWGGDWDDDTEVDDNKFNDLAHYELQIANDK